MKGTITTIVFVCIGIFTAVYIGFGFDRKENPTAVDYEVDGLNEKYVLKFSHIVAEKTPKGLAASLFAQLVKEKTNGWVEVQVYPNGILYDAQEEFKALKRNEVHIIAPAFSEITVHDQNWLVMDLPFLFKDTKAVNDALNGKTGKLLNSSISKYGYKGIGFWNNSFKQLTNDLRPIHSPEDVKGLSVRIMPSAVLEDTYRLLGASPYLINFNEVYEALSTKVIDGTENTLSNIYSKGFYLKQNYLTISNHNYLGYAVLMDTNFWNSLPVDYQSKIEEAMGEVSLWLLQYAQTHNEEVYDYIEKSERLEIHHLTLTERTVWREKLEPLYQQYAKKIDPSIMNEVNRLLIDTE